MSRRTQAVARLGPEWVLPDFATRRWTTIGNVGSPRRAIVDPRGLVTPRSGGWSVDWWVGADDRWHFPSREASVRQHLIDSSPVVETSMRIPGGDAVERVFAVPGAEEFVVVEVENRSSVPFVIAFAVRPFSPNGSTAVREIRLEDRAVTVDGRLGILLPRAPARLCGSSLEGGDCALIITSGEAGTALPDPLGCRAGLAQAAFLFPVPHTATVRALLPMAPERRSRSARRRRPADPIPDVPAIPTAADVARGWAAQMRPGMQLELPPGRLADAVQANRRFLLLFSSGGHSAERERSGLRRVRRDPFREPQRDAKRPAIELERALAELRAGDERALERLDWLVEAASPTFTWSEEIDPHLLGDRGGDGHDARTAAAFLSFVHALLVRDVEGGLALCSLLPAAWVGQPLEVHDAPTKSGTISFAVRWHGDRPALLWELQERDQAPVRITCPGLDPGWSTTERRGDALLCVSPLESPAS